jgi:hypothetical protein
MIQALGRVMSTNEGGASPVTGCLFCADCGASMHVTKTSHTLKSGEQKTSAGYNCHIYYSVGKTACCSHYIGAKDLNALICEDIRKKAGDVLQDEDAARSRFYAIKSKLDGTKQNSDKAALKQAQKRLAELDKLLKATFEKSVLGGASAEMFTELAAKHDSEKRELKTKAAQLSAAVEKQSRAENDADAFISLMKKRVNVTELDRSTVVELMRNRQRKCGNSEGSGDLLQLRRKYRVVNLLSLRVLRIPV